MKQSSVNRENIDYNIYNALNMVNEDLGESYIQDGFNPFDSNFQLNENYVTDILKNQKEAKEVLSPSFVNEGEKSTKEAFEKSLHASQESLNKIIELLDNPRIPEEKKKKLRKILEYLRMRIQMLTLQIKKIKEKKERNTFEMYQNINALNWQYANEFESSYNVDHFDIMEHIENLLNLTLNPEYQQSKELLEEAQKIIEANLQKNPNQRQKEAIKEEIKEFVEDVNNGESLVEETQELIDDINKIFSNTNTKDNVMERKAASRSNNREKFKQDDGRQL